MIRLLKNEDRETVLDYVLRNETAASFLYSNVMEAGLENNPGVRRCADYYGYFKGDRLQGILTFYNLGSCIPHFEASDAMSVFAEIMCKRDFQVLLGMSSVIKPLFEKIKSMKSVLEYDECEYLINNNFKPFMIEDILIKKADWSCAEEVDFISKAFTTGLNNPTSKDEAIKIIKGRSETEEFLIAKRGGKIVAQACIQSYTERLCQIGGVCTAEEERGKGYCKAIVSELCSCILRRGKVPALFVLKSNTPAIRAYKALGFDYFDDYLMIKFSRDNVN